MTPEEMQELLGRELNFGGTQYKGRSWTNKVKTVSDLLHQMDSMDSLMGRKGAIIPKRDAGDEEWSKFFQDIAATDEDYAKAVESLGENVRKDLAATMKSFGLPAKAAKAVAEAAKKAVDDNYTKHYSKESFETLLSESGIDKDSLPELTKVVNEIMGDKFLETHTEIPNEATLSMIKFAKGLTDKYGVKTPIEPTGKPANGNSNDPDPFEAALKSGNDSVGFG